MVKPLQKFPKYAAAKRSEVPPNGMLPALVTGVCVVCKCNDTQCDHNLVGRQLVSFAYVLPSAIRY